MSLRQTIVLAVTSMIATVPARAVPCRPPPLRRSAIRYGSRAYGIIRLEEIERLGPLDQPGGIKLPIHHLSTRQR